LADYTEKYIDQCFYIWYDGDRAVGNGLIDRLPETDDGKKPGVFTVKRWVEEKGWIERADALDATVSVRIEEEVIDKRVAMYKRHAEIGEFEVEAGFEYLKAHGIKKEETALRAITDGTELQRKSVGVEDVLRKISSMTPDQLDNELRKLLGQKKDDEFIVDGETTESNPDTESKT